MSRIVSSRGAALGAVLFAAACSAVYPSQPDGGPDLDAGAGADAGPEPDAGETPPDPEPDAGPRRVLPRASKSSTIAITSDDLRVVMSNPEDGSISVFEADSENVLARVATGREPGAVVIHPDDHTTFVANRADATVVKVTGIHTAKPTVTAKVDVGSEPTGLALSPTGARLYVAEWAEGRVSVIDTATMKVVGAVPVRNPRAITVTNDGDEDDADELVIVPEFFGEPTGTEATDTSRLGRVRVLSAADLASVRTITFQPIDSGFAPHQLAAGAPTVMTSPNQLSAVAVIDGRIYVPSVSASPAGPVSFQANVQPVVYVADLATGREDRTARGSANLARLVQQQAPADKPRFFLADLVDVAFVGDKVAYTLSRGADVLQRVVYDPDRIKIGSNFNAQIDLNVVPPSGGARCQTPNGVTTAHSGGRAYVNCWVSRSLGVVDLSSQSLARTIESAPVPPSEADVQLGRRFYFTGRGRWSQNGWSSCGSCHPDGLSDNVTWSFAAGPRQSTSMDGSFSHGPGPQKQRVFNWTGIFDEIHDFERNTRGVSGGKGAVTVPDPAIAGAACGNLATELQVTLGGNLRRPVKTDQDTTPGQCTDDWDKIEAFARTIRPPRGLRFLDPAAVARGAELFGEPTATANNAGCVRCHGGPGWTVSRRFFVPDTAGNDALAAQPFTPPSIWPASWNRHTLQLSNQPSDGKLDGPEANTVLGPEQIACVLRNVGTFGVPGKAAATDALERRDNGTRAQGRLGYNVPSLYGLSVGAPYLHHGSALTLEKLFEESAWGEHLAAGSAVWLLGDAAQVAQRKRDMIAFLLSIDATTAEQAIPTQPVRWDGCPGAL